MCAVITKIVDRAVKWCRLAMLVIVVSICVVLALGYADMLSDLTEIHLTIECWAVGKAASVGCLVAV